MSSIAGVLVSAAGVGALTTLETVLLRNGRSIQNIIPDCVMEERHKDEMEITSNPVEQGTPANDHAYLKAPELVMRVGWSDSSRSLLGLFNGTYPASIRDTYDQLRQLQTQFQIISVVTGKRVYTNMMLRSVTVVTTRETENALMVEAIFQQIFRVSTKVASPSSLGLTQNQTNPQNTQPPIPAGTQQLGSANSAAAASIGGM